jgi:integrase
VGVLGEAGTVREPSVRVPGRDADLENRIVRIDRALTYAGGKVHLGEPKTAAGRRTVMLPAFVLDALKRAKAKQNKRRLLIGVDWVERNLIVDRGDGDFWIPPSFSTGWRRFAAKAGFLDVPLLGLRHGSATLMLAAGVPDPVAAQIMGHADTRILRRYQDVVPELKREAASKMGELLGG